MGAAPSGDDVLDQLRDERREALDQLVATLYAELRAVAHRQRRARPAGAGTPTLGTTALVNEAYLKLVDQSRATWRDRAHFLALAAVAMRHLLIDHARRSHTGKRGGGRRLVTLEEDAIALEDQPGAMLDIDDALQSLEQLNPRLAQVFVARFFGGLTEKETAEAFGVTTRTIERDWTKARVLLQQALDA